MQGKLLVYGSSLCGAFISFLCGSSKQRLPNLSMLRLLGRTMRTQRCKNKRRKGLRDQYEKFHLCNFECGSLVFMNRNEVLASAAYSLEGLQLSAAADG